MENMYEIRPMGRDLGDDKDVIPGVSKVNQRVAGYPGTWGPNIQRV